MLETKNGLGIAFEAIALELDKDNGLLVDEFINQFLCTVGPDLETVVIGQNETDGKLEDVTEAAVTFKNIKAAKAFYSKRGNGPINTILKELLSQFKKL